MCGSSALGLGGADGQCVGDDNATVADGGGAGNPLHSVSGVAAFNAHSRRVAAALWATKPLVFLAIMRLVIEPLKQLLSEKLGVGGCEWDLQQMRASAKGALAERSCQRAYRPQPPATGLSLIDCR